MRNLTFTLLSLLLSPLALANCVDLSGSFIIDDPTTQCRVSRKGDVLFSHSNLAIINIMAKPAVNYGYLLSQLAINDMQEITIEHNNCESIRINSDTTENKSYLVEMGEFPYFGARTPITVNIDMSEIELTQKMLITKYTVISNGEQKVFKDLNFSANFTIDSDDNLVIKAGVEYGRRNSKYEMVECVFKRR